MKLFMKTSSRPAFKAFRREAKLSQPSPMSRSFFTKLTICYVAQFPSPTGSE
jgi:hypothetical protein